MDIGPAVKLRFGDREPAVITSDQKERVYSFLIGELEWFQLSMSARWESLPK